MINDKNSKVGHMFKFLVWKKALDVRYILNAFVAFLIALILQYYSVLMIQGSDDANAKDDEIDLAEASTDITNSERIELRNELLTELNSITNDYYEYISILLVLNIFTIAYLFQSFQEKIYATLRNIYVPLVDGKLIVNLITTIVVIYWVYKHYFDFTVGLDKYEEQRRVKIVIDRIDSDPAFNIYLIIALLTSLQFIRIIFALELSRIFGPMIKIITRMLMDLTIFMFLYCLILVIFTCSGQLMFSELDDYSNFTKAIIVTFSQGLGDFDYGIYEDLTKFDTEVGYVFLSVWLIVSMIMLLNFLIAILSTTYSFLSERQNALYLKKVILLRQRYDYHKYYSNIVSAFVPLNILPIVCNFMTIG